MRKLYYLIFILFSTAEIYSQDGWFWQNPLPCGNTLNDVCFIDANTGIAVGDAGTIIHTINGGKDWTIQPSGTGLPLKSVCFTDADNGWAVGGCEYWEYEGNNSWEVDSSVILHTTNSGLTWKRQISETNYRLESVCFITQGEINIGTAVGYNGTILRTTDGGNNWVKQLCSTTECLYDVCFTDTDTGVIVGTGGTMLRTTNGGENWIQLSEVGGPLFDVCFANKNIGIAVGCKWNDDGGSTESLILRTTDSGVNWVNQTKGNFIGELHGVCFTDTNNGTAIGYDSWSSERVILRTTDGGTNWVKYPIGPSTYPYLSNQIQYLYGVCFTNETTGTAVGSVGTILRTTDGGNNWFNQSKGTIKAFTDISFVDANTGWVIGENAILKSNDGGKSWNRQSTDSTIYLYDVCVTDANTVTVVGYDWNTNIGLILRTTDGGNKWVNQNNNIIGYLKGVCFTDVNTGTIVGGDWSNDSGIILRTTNGGSDWVKQPVDSIQGFQGLNAVYFTDENNGTVIGGRFNGITQNYESIILTTTDAGKKWDIHSAETTSILNDTHFTDSNNGTIVGGGICAGQGIILRTTDGGKSWFTQYLFTPYDGGLSGVYFTDANNGTAVGTGKNGEGLIFRTIDGGSNWVSQTIGTNNWLQGVCFTDVLTGWAVGMNGTILHTTNGGVTFVEETQTDINEVPKDFLLYQNYPNPFNPSTSIQYAVSSRQFVVLRVFDVLGNEIATLVNEEKPVGNYEVTWDAENLASGIYFYQLKAGNNVETKKMILLK